MKTLLKLEYHLIVAFINIKIQYHIFLEYLKKILAYLSEGQLMCPSAACVGIKIYVDDQVVIDYI